MVQTSTAQKNRTAPETAGTAPSTIDGILERYGLGPARGGFIQRLQATVGLSPPRSQPFIAPAGMRLYLPIRPMEGYSGVTLQLQEPSPTKLDNLELVTDNVFAAATHEMWVGLLTPAVVIYEGRLGKEGQNALPQRAMLVPTSGAPLELEVTGIKIVPELEVLTRQSAESFSVTAYSPDVVVLDGGMRTFFDIGRVHISSGRPVMLNPDSHLRVPLTLSGSYSHSAAEK